MSIPSEVVRCVRHGIAPKEQEGMDWCASADCEQCEEAVWSELLRERDRLKAERDRALAELDKALGEREDAMLSERNAAYNAGYDEGFASADDWLAQHEDAMAEHGWVKLPVDADGVPIHVGDRMTPNGMGTDFKVRQMHFNGKWSLDLEGFGISQTCPDMCHHHHAPTVEDTLREMLYKAHIYDEREMELLPDLIAEYAAKLRLRGDDE